MIHIYRVKNYILVCLFIFMYAPDIYSQDELTGSGWYIDQDLFGPDFLIDKNEDRDYTMGLEYSFTGPIVRKRNVYRQLSGFLSDVSLQFGLIPKGECQLRNDDGCVIPSPNPLVIYSGSFGNTAFTPDDLGTTAPIFDDRPYANLLYMSVAQTYALDGTDKPSGVAYTNKLVLGVLGLDIGKAVQRKIHEWTDGVTPSGWDNQISEGGELTALLSHRRHYEWIPTGDLDWKKPEVSYYWDASVGYYTELGAGIQMRYGRVRSDYFSHLSNPLENTNQVSRNSGDSYAFLSLGAKAIGYNALLQGQFRNSNVTLSSDQINRLVAHASIGYAHDFDNFKLTYAVNYRSSEIDGGEGDRDHFFGGIYLTFNK